MVGLMLASYFWFGCDHPLPDHYGAECSGEGDSACGGGLECVDRGSDEGRICSFACNNDRDCDFGVCVLACRDDGFCSPHALCK